MNLGPSVIRHTAAAAVAVATATVAAAAATATSDAVHLVVLVWIAVAALATTKVIALTHAVKTYNRAYRTGQEHARWAATLTRESTPNVAGVE